MLYAKTQLAKSFSAQTTRDLSPALVAEPAPQDHCSAQRFAGLLRANRIKWALFGELSGVRIGGRASH